MQTAQFIPSTGTSVITLQEKLEALKQEHDEVLVPLSELRVTEGGMLRLFDQELPMTETAVTTLAQKAGIPASYVLQSPNDIAAQNFEYWLPAKKGDLRVVLNGGLVMGFMGANYQPVRNDMLVTTVLDRKGALDLEQYVLDEHGLSLVLLAERPASEIRVGDIVKAGVRVENSEFKQTRLNLEGYLHRLICLNGVTVGERLMDQTLQRELWQTPVSLLERFVGEFDRVVETTIAFGPAIELLSQMRLWFSDEEDETEKLRQFLQVGKMPGKYQEALSTAFMTEEDTGYGLWNSVSRTGRDTIERKLRQRWQKLGGWMLANIPEYQGIFN